MKKQITAKLTAVLLSIAALFALTTLGEQKAFAYEPSVTDHSRASSTVKAGENFDFTLDVSCSGESLTLVSIDFDELVLISGIDPGSAMTSGRSYGFTLNAPSGVKQKQYIRYTVGYTYQDGEKWNDDGSYTPIMKSGSKTFTTIVEISGASPDSMPTIENISVPEEVTKGEKFNVSFDIFNFPSGAKNVAISMEDSSGNSLARLVLNGAQETYTLNASGMDATGNRRFTIKLTYDGQSATKSDYVKVVNAVEGSLKIQSIKPPTSAVIDSYAIGGFTISNPTATAVKGAEAFLYDENGKELDSIYISEILANSSSPEALNFLVSGKTGTRTYTLTINYKNASGESKSVSEKFNLKAITEEEKANEGEPEKNSVLKIQTVDAPAQAYAGVKTSIPYVIVNAGKGTAYNVEVYVTDENGVEIAREYVGSVAASLAREGVIKLKFAEVNSFDLTFNVEAENYNESKSYASKNFDYKVVNYRASISDVGGFEWIWNNTATIEFTVINGGNETMYNVRAVLQDANGNIFGNELYIGNILSGEKKERNRFRDVYIYSEDNSEMLEMKIALIYENADAQEFNVDYNMTATLYSDVGGGDMWIDDGGGFIDDPGMWIDEGMGMEEQGGKFPWIAVIIGAPVLVVGAIILIVVLSKKKKKKTEDDDVEYFLSQLNLKGSLNPNSSNSAINSTINSAMPKPTDSVYKSQEEVKK